MHLSIIETPTTAPAAPEVDLFDLGAPDAAPTPAPAPAAAADDSFDAFQTAGPTSDAFGGADPFAATPAPAPAAQLQQPPQQQSVQFDAFGNASNSDGATNVNAVSDAFGSMNMAQQQPPQQGMNGMAQLGQPQVNGTGGNGDDDDFGDFGGASTTPAAAATDTKAKDSLSGLINLDGLQKNVKKTNNLNNPVVSGDAASQYMHYQQQMAAQGNVQNIGAQVSFRGIDGLNTMPTDFSPKGVRQNNRQTGQPIMAAHDMNTGQGGGVSSGGSDAISSMFAPQPQQQGQPGGHMMGGMQGQQQQMGTGQQGMMSQGGMMPNQGMGMQGQQGMMNQQGMMPNQQGMMNQGMMQNQGMQGNMMGGGMNQMGGGMGQMGGMGMGNQFQ